MSGNYPAGVNDNDPYFDLPDAGEDDDDETYTIPCSFCGKPTTLDATYGNLCYRCIRANNE